MRNVEVLLTVRAGRPYEGKIDVPGGFLHSGETAIEGLRREIREELGVEINVTMSDCLQVEPHRYGDDGNWTLAIGFAAGLASGEPKPSDDVADIMWAREGELDDLDFAWPHDRELARRALRRERQKGKP